MLMSRTSEHCVLSRFCKCARVPRDSILVVHSAIALLRRQGFRAEAMIEALLEYMQNGTLVMPTMTWRTVTVDQPHWDELGTPSHTGVEPKYSERALPAPGASIRPIRPQLMDRKPTSCCPDIISTRPLSRPTVPMD